MSVSIKGPSQRGMKQAERQDAGIGHVRVTSTSSRTRASAIGCSSKTTFPPLGAIARTAISCDARKLIVSNATVMESPVAALICATASGSE